jgi:hypothetical protein
MKYTGVYAAAVTAKDCMIAGGHMSILSPVNLSLLHDDCLYVITSKLHFALIATRTA